MPVERCLPRRWDIIISHGENLELTSIQRYVAGKPGELLVHSYGWPLTHVPTMPQHLDDFHHGSCFSQINSDSVWADGCKYYSHLSSLKHIDLHYLLPNVLIIELI